MSSTNQYLEFVLDLLGELDDVVHPRFPAQRHARLILRCIEQPCSFVACKKQCRALDRAR